MNDYTVYCHIFPNKKRYVGITKQKIKRRWGNGYGYICSPLMYNAIKKYLWHNIEHKLLYTNLSKKEAEEIEIKLIKEWKTNIRKYGYNIANGGSLAGVYTLETRLKISKARLGKKSSELTKLRQSISHLAKINYLSKKVNQYDLDGNFLKEWKCMNEVYRVLNISHQNISKCCMKKRKTAGGYIWKYKEVNDYE